MILASDYDGTFHVDEPQTLKNLDAVKRWRQEGHQFGLVTGRSYEMALLPIKEYNLPSIKKVPRIFALSSEGTFTVRMKNPTIFEIRLKAPRISMEQLRALDTIWQFSLGCKDEAMAAKCAEEINCQLGEDFCAYYNRKDVDVVAAGVSKGVGIRRYMELEGKTAEQIWVIGDGGNDVDMIRDFNGYTIQAGCEAAKQAASGIFDSVEELIKNALQENTGVV